MVDIGEARGLDLAQSLTCGQCFRWVPSPTIAGGWQGVVQGNFSTFVVENGHLLSITDEKTFDIAFWRNYFALDMDYTAIQARFAKSKRLAACVAQAPGIRVLRQPFFETLCTFIISQNNNIPRIRMIVDRLCLLCGAPLGNGLYAFPTAQELAAQTPESLAVLRAGWRSDYLLDAARRVAAGQCEPAALEALPLAEARSLLMEIRGVGPKVADCTLLFGLGRWEACPMDVWMKRALRLQFAQGLPRCCAGYEGLAQQYVFAWARENLPKGG